MAEWPQMSTRSHAVAEVHAEPAPLLLRIGFWACVAIAVAVVVRRLIAFAVPPRSGPPDLVVLDQVFTSHAALTLAHIVPALLFVLLAPFVLLDSRGRFRLAEPLLFATGWITGLTAYAMSIYSVGGWIERSAVLLFDTLFLGSLTLAYRERHVRESKRKWLVRAVVILLGIATTRPVMGIFFATSRVTHLEPRQFFGIAFWIGFSINLIVVEAWLRRRRGHS